jgi:hypothetical protein
MEKTNNPSKKTVKKMGKIGIYPIFPMKTLFFPYPKQTFCLKDQLLLDIP